MDLIPARRLAQDDRPMIGTRNNDGLMNDGRAILLHLPAFRYHCRAIRQLLLQLTEELLSRVISAASSCDGRSLS